MLVFCICNAAVCFLQKRKKTRSLKSQPSINPNRLFRRQLGQLHSIAVKTLHVSRCSSKLLYQTDIGGHSHQVRQLTNEQDGPLDPLALCDLTFHPIYSLFSPQGRHLLTRRGRQQVLQDSSVF